MHVRNTVTVLVLLGLSGLSAGGQNNALQLSGGLRSGETGQAQSVAAAGSDALVLSLAEAVSRAIESHPALAASNAEVAAAQGLRLQAGLRPNPLLVLQQENLRFWGTPAMNYTQDVESFVYLVQPLETGGRRGRRIDYAAENVRLAELERHKLRQQIAGRVKQAYWYAAGTRHTYELLLENRRNFQQIIEYHEVRVKEGAMAENDLIRVLLESQRLAIDANGARLEAERARIGLLREMGALHFPEVKFSDSLEDIALPAFSLDPRTAIERRPEMLIADQSVKLAEAYARLQQALSRPDVELMGGFKRNAGFNTLMAGVQMDLPLSDRNQGNIAAARAEVRAAEASRAATAALIRAEVEAARSEFDIRRRQLTEAMQPLCDRANESARIANAAYREAGADLLRLLDAERVRIESQMLLYRTLTEYKQSVARLETALGVTQ